MLIITCSVREHRLKKSNKRDGLGFASELQCICSGQMQEWIKLIADKTLATRI